MEFRENNLLIHPEHQYNDGDDTHFVLKRRFGNNLASAEFLLKRGELTPENAKREKTIFTKTLRKAVELNAPEKKGITLRKLEELADFIDKLDWFNEADMETAIKKTSEILTLSEQI